MRNDRPCSAADPTNNFFETAWSHMNYVDAFVNTGNLWHRLA